MICASCGTTNSPKSKFCVRCGLNMNRANDGKKINAEYSRIHPKFMIKRSGRRLWHPVAIGLGLLGMALLIVVVLQVIHDSGAPHKQARIIETRSQDPQIEAAMKLIAARFNCSCGSCGEKSLDICAYNRAIEERQFIRNALQTGQSEDQIIAAVNTTYGSRKLRSAGDVDCQVLQFWENRLSPRTFARVIPGARFGRRYSEQMEQHTLISDLRPLGRTGLSHGSPGVQASQVPKAERYFEI
jgi:cytochrome c-type biogenesis protein CcmH/NrfF